MGLYKRTKLAQVGSSHGGKMHKRTLGQVQETFALHIKQKSIYFKDQEHMLNVKQVDWDASYHFAQENSATGCQCTGQTHKLGKHVSKTQVLRHINASQHGSHLWYTRAWGEIKQSDKILKQPDVIAKSYKYSIQEQLQTNKIIGKSMARTGGCHGESAQNKVKMKSDSVCDYPHHVSRHEVLLQGIWLHKSNVFLSVSSESIFFGRTNKTCLQVAVKKWHVPICVWAEARNT